MNPPPIPTWLLRHFVRNDALEGDLAEEFRRGRSTLWYWRQAGFAVLTCAARDLREHKLLALRAVVIGWVVLIPWFYFTRALYRMTAPSTNPPGAWFNGSTIQRMAWWALIPYGAPMLIVWCGGSVIVGWLVARLHRGHQAATLLACVTSQLPWTFLWAWSVWRNAQGGVDSMYDFPNEVSAVLVFVGIPVCTLLGGLWGARPSGRAVS